MTRAVLSLGSNLGDSAALLREAVQALGAAVVRVSSVYRTPPWGPVAQDDFLNIAVLASDPGLDAGGWLERCHVLERAARRERLVRWGPRTLDADVIGVWDGGHDGPLSGRGGSAGTGFAVGPCPAWDESTAIRSDDPTLILPHPRAFERAFVLLPWAEVQPEAVLPDSGAIRDLLARLDVTDIDLVGPLFAAPAAGESSTSGLREPRGGVGSDRPATRGASATSAPAPSRSDPAEPR